MAKSRKAEAENTVLEAETAAAEIPAETDGEPPFDLPEASAQTPETPVQAEAPTSAQVLVVEEKEPNVRIIYIDSCIPNNQVAIGPKRFVTGSGRIFSVPLSVFEGEFMTPLTMELMDTRKFIVLDGLTKEQRQQYNCDYGPGEVIRKEGTFDFLLSCPVREAAEAFSALCPEHRALVAARFHEAFEKRDNRVTRDRCEALNEISRSGQEGPGAFTDIIQAINAGR